MDFCSVVGTSLRIKIHYTARRYALINIENMGDGNIQLFRGIWVRPLNNWALSQGM